MEQPEQDARITRVHAPKIANLVASQLRRQVLIGTLKNGDVLPPEADLIDQFGVSRPTLREALRVLESEQLIEVRRGAHGGARVRTPTTDVAAKHVGIVLQLHGATLADVYNGRTVIEQHCARLLAEGRTDADLSRLWAEIEHGEAAMDDPSRFIRAHTRFHAVVVDLAGSATLNVLSGLLREIVDAGNYSRIAEDHVAESLGRATHKGARAHRRLVELIEAKDADGAEQLWQSHLTDADDYLASGTAKTILDLFEYV
ncbi:FCD domain-containing protein [Nocardioides sp. WS12]|uniref:FadR/GntR family transcriptional regulator n=1 Tax=Nocardioides sp. WS12 TaxID=2486272 RepID=UPI00191F9428|nr:FCD domain-containing protein [Nocardioides sp. WS12]